MKRAVIKGFTKVEGTAFEYVNKKAGLRYKFDNSQHYHPFILLDANHREIGSFETAAELEQAVKDRL